MSANLFTKYGGVNPYFIVLSQEHQYTKFNLPFNEGHAKDPKQTVTLPIGTILWCQEKSFDVEQLIDLKGKGFPYQWGFGPCCEMIPFEKIKLGKLEILNILS